MHTETPLADRVLQQKTRNKAKTEVLDQTEILSDAQNIPFCNKVDNTIWL